MLLCECAWHCSYLTLTAQQDFHTLDLEPYRYSGTNMTGLRIVKPDSPLVKAAVEQWASAAAMVGETSDLEPGNLRVGLAKLWRSCQLCPRKL